MSWDRGHARALPDTEEIGRPPAYPAGNEDKPPAYSIRPPSLPAPAHHAQSTRYSHTTSAGSAHMPKTIRQANHKRRLIDWCYWFKWIFFGACVCAAVFTGLYVGLGVGKEKNQSDRSSVYPPIRNDTLSNATIYDLAAAECEPGTFILHQDMFGDVWIRGELHNSLVADTFSMAPTKLYFAGSLSPQKPTNITAVCWPLPSIDTVRVALYFVSPFPDPAFKYSIIETIIDIYTTNLTLVDYPAFSDTHRAIIKVHTASTVAAVILPSEGVRLYYSELLPDSKKIGVMEVARGWPEPTEYFAGASQNTRDLHAKAYRTWSALTAAAVDRNDGTTPVEVHVFFVDNKSRLSRVVRKGAETWPAQPLAQYSTAGASEIKIQKMIAIMPHITNGHPEPDLFFINNNRVTDIFGNPNPPTGEDISEASLVYITAPRVVGGDVPGPTSIPQAVQYPSLLAVTCWNFNDNRTMGLGTRKSPSVPSRERLQLFYLKQSATWYDKGKTYENVQSLGQGIVKVTARSDPYLGYSWNLNEVANGTR
ncbi:hypothetical protein ONS95_002527 [Cadophora gregata]|uniref:uncharacterized protein n=1 Tax=Cadophora gregata TaxID=51156 RepID=UPI0026DC6A96|nr:uncharacterized protein ONS95_002527 [Cadophora gregata]KAK0109857.1 hypothetical protein ONS95_002527 [Cadophora gregata]KAK0110516.1 hypothetical protein ONS96_002125 [Cadophora gregata f. sp. sojae]